MPSDAVIGQLLTPDNKPFYNLTAAATKLDFNNQVDLSTITQDYTVPKDGVLITDSGQVDVNAGTKVRNIDGASILYVPLRNVCVAGSTATSDYNKLDNKPVYLVEGGLHSMDCDFHELDEGVYTAVFLSDIDCGLEDVMGLICTANGVTYESSQLIEYYVESSDVNIRYFGNLSILIPSEQDTGEDYFVAAMVQDIMMCYIMTVNTTVDDLNPSAYLVVRQEYRPVLNPDYKGLFLDATNPSGSGYFVMNNTILSSSTDYNIPLTVIGLVGSSTRFQLDTNLDTTMYHILRSTAQGAITISVDGVDHTYTEGFRVIKDFDSSQGTAYYLEIDRPIVPSSGSVITLKHVAGSNIGDNSVCMGQLGSASTGDYSVSEGSSIATEKYSHAEGYVSVATGNSSHAEGYSNVAFGTGSHAEGASNIANGTASHAEGIGTITSTAFQHVEGKYNLKDSSDQYAHIVGNGTSDNARSNAFTVDWSGNIAASGTVSGTNIGTITGYNAVLSGTTLTLTSITNSGD